jgi:hypothetical protein
MKDLDGFSFVTPSSSSSTTTTTTTSDENASRRLQLVMNGPNLAPFKCSVTYTRLPSLLQYGVIRLLSDVLEHTNSPHTSNRIVENSLILLTYGINYLNEKRYEMDTQFLQFKAKQKQLKKNKKDLKRKALEIQKAWRCHHFHTSRLPPLQLSTKSYLLLLEQDPPETKIDTLKSQEFTQRTEKYMKELQIRLAKRKEEKMEQKQLEKQKAQELREKKRALVRFLFKLAIVMSSTTYLDSKRIYRYNNEENVMRMYLEDGFI